MPNKLKNTKISVIGLGYVGLPLALEFSDIYRTKGFDIDVSRINQLKEDYDRTNEVTSKELIEKNKLIYTSEIDELSDSNVYIVTVPTPIDNKKKPDFKYLINASKAIGVLLSKGDIVIYESTVYPGATEEICIPVLEQYSDYILNKDFFVGYSPERINPGDKTKRITEIMKVTSGSNEKTADFVDQLYATIIKAGTHKAKSIKVAEAAKVIENTQRDLNIALMNELSMIFKKMNIDTKEVLDAAKTKWNFLPFEPGIVGGHCIGVDPYYLTYKAEQIGYSPEIILAGRQLNDSMSGYVACQLSEEMELKNIKIESSNILIMGFTFKENCPDHRNTKVIDMFYQLKDKGATVDIFDPWVDINLVKKEYDIELVEILKDRHYDAIIIAVKHKEFFEMGIEGIKKLGRSKVIVFDMKSIFKKESSDIRL